MDERNQNIGEKESKGTSALKEILSWVFSFAFALVVTLLLKNYVIINADVPTGSMENTIMPGDRLIGNRLAYVKSDPQRGDVVIFHYPDNEKELYVKRIIGLPGETVDITDGVITITVAGATGGKVLQEDYLKEDWVVATGPYHFEIPENCYLMMGDNRNDSWDARYWTNCYVEQDKILGKAAVVYWPVSDMGKIE